MGVPTQGVGTTTPWVADGSGYDAGTYDLPNDGAQWSFSTVMVLVARLINSVGGLYSGASSQVAAYTGTIWTISAGNLSTFLHSLADHAAKLDANNTFSASGVGVAVTNNCTVGGNLGVTGACNTGQINATGSVNATGNITTNLAVLSVGSLISSTGNVSSTTGNVTAGGNVTCTGSVFGTAGVSSGGSSDVHAGGNLTCAGSVVSQNDLATLDNVSVGSLSPSYGGGTKVLAIAPASAIPSGSPTGCVIYVDGSGNLTALTSGGHTRIIAAV